MIVHLSSPIGEMREQYEVVVVGSGYGGAIATSRLVRAEREVCLLERGREFQPREYPDTGPEALREMQIDCRAASRDVFPLILEHRESTL